MSSPDLPTDNSLYDKRNKSSINEINNAIEQARNSRHNCSIPLQMTAKRIELLQNAIEEIDGQIQQRKELQENLRTQTTMELSELRSALYELQNTEAHPSTRISLQGHISNVDRGHRLQEVEFFRDLCMLSRELRQAKKELMTALLPFSALSMGNRASVKKL